MVGAARFELATPCAQDIGCPHLGINRFNNLQGLLVEPWGNHQLQFLLHSRNFDSKTTGKTRWEVLMEVPGREISAILPGAMPEGAPLLFRQGVWPNCSASVLTAGHSVIRSGMMTPPFTIGKRSSTKLQSR